MVPDQYFSVQLFLSISYQKNPSYFQKNQGSNTCLNKTLLFYMHVTALVKERMLILEFSKYVKPQHATE